MKHYHRHDYRPGGYNQEGMTLFHFREVTNEKLRDTIFLRKNPTIAFEKTV